MTSPPAWARRTLGAGLALVLVGCAAGGGAETTFRDGLTAVADARAGEAYRHLGEVRSLCGAAPLGQQAVLVEAAAALGGRVGEREPGRAAVLAAAFLRQPRPAAWGVPIAESLYLMARELGADVPSEEAVSSVFGEGADVGARPAADCGARWDPTREAVAVPSLQGSGVTAELRRLQSRLVELEEEVERLRALLKVPEDGGG